jgi:hypothetical protein
MPERFLQTLLTHHVLDAQEHYYGRRAALRPATAERDPLGPEEVEFIARRDSFYLATPRFTEQEVERRLAPLRERIAELEAQPAIGHTRLKG